MLFSAMLAYESTIRPYGQITMRVQAYRKAILPHIRSSGKES